MIKQYRKKAIEVEAIQFINDDADIICAISDFVGETLSVDYGVIPPVLKIHTLEGIMQAIPGDWIIKGVKGEFYPCKSEIFELTYESAEQPKPQE